MGRGALDGDFIFGRIWVGKLEKGGLEKFRGYNENVDSKFLGSEGMYMEGVYIGYIIDV